LIGLRRELEKKNIIIMCNGGAENVYPSAMQQSMGTGRVAYKLYLGQKAKMADVVDIFEYEENLKYANIDKQINFFKKWIDDYTQ
jgi:hypothetical protein